MSSESTKAETAGFNRRLSVSRETLFLSSASLRWWNMATPQPALEAVLDRRFALVGNGWVPVNAPPESADRTIAPPSRCRPPGRPSTPWHLRSSPVRLLFEGRVDIDKVRDWFMQTTETRSLATRSGSGKRLRAEEGLGAVGGRAKGRAGALGEDLGKTAARRRRRRKAAGELVGHLSLDSRAPGKRRRVAGELVGHPSLDNRRHSSLDNKVPGKRRKAAGELLEHPPVDNSRHLSVAIRRHPSLDSRGHLSLDNRPHRRRRRIAGQLVGHPSLDNKGHLSVAIQSRPSVGSRAPGMRRKRRGRVGWRGGGRQVRDAGPNKWWSGKLSLRKLGERQRAPPTESPVGHRSTADKAGGEAWWQTDWSAWESPPVLTVRGTDYQLVPVGKRLAHMQWQDSGVGDGGGRTGGAASSSSSSFPVADSPLTPSAWHLGCPRECWVLLRNIRGSERLGGGGGGGSPCKVRHKAGRWAPTDRPAPGEATPASLTPPPSQEQQGAAPTPLRPGSPLAEDRWRVAGLRECRVLLRKIKPRRNGLPARQPPLVPSRHRDQHYSDNFPEVEHHFHSYSCEEKRHQCFAADVAAFVEVQGSTSDLETTRQPREKGAQQRAAETFTDTRWKLRGLKECSVVLNKITPLVGNHFLTLADGHLFRLGVADIKDESNRQELS